MTVAADADEYMELELVCDEIVEQITGMSLAKYDQQLSQTQDSVAPIFAQPSSGLSVAAIMAGARVKQQLSMDAEYACRNPLQKTPAKTTNVLHRPSSQRERVAHSPDTPPEACCGMPLTERTTQKGANAGRKYLKCDVCGKFKRWADDEPQGTPGALETFIR